MNHRGNVLALSLAFAVIAVSAQTYAFSKLTHPSISFEERWPRASIRETLESRHDREPFKPAPLGRDAFARDLDAGVTDGRSAGDEPRW